MDRFLVIGATGFIGGHLMKHLAQSNAAEVMGTSSRSHRQRHAKFDLQCDSIARSLPPRWRNAGEEKVAILCAGVSPLDRCATDAAYARAVMVDGSRRCVDDLADLGYRVVFLSTSYVFGDDARGFREDDATAPINQYGIMKQELELYLKSSHPSALIARLGKVVGNAPEGQHLFTHWHQLAERREPIVCIENHILQPTLVDDVAITLRQACQKRLAGVYHIANPEPISRLELAGQFLSTCGLQTEIRAVSVGELQLTEPRPVSPWLRSDKIQGELGLRFTTTSEVLEQYCTQVARRDH
jgi:dTDP-4-dehydrorhamnose reductase